MSEKVSNKKVLHEVIDSVAKLQPDKNAIEAGEYCLSYGALKSTTTALSLALLNAGIKNEDVVGSYLRPSGEYIVSILSINKAGGVFLPLQIDYPSLRTLQIIGDAKPGIIITQKKFLGKLQQLLLSDAFICSNAPRILLVEILQDSIWIGQAEAIGEQIADVLPELRTQLPPTEISADDGNYLMYTSGSTGKPKMILGAHKSLSHFIHWQKNEFGFSSDIRVSQLAPLSFDVSLRDIMLPLVTGGTVCIPETGILQSPSKLLQWISEKEISVIHTVPSVFKLLTSLLKDEPGLLCKIATLKYIFLAGESLYTRDIRNWRSVAGDQVQLVNLYGPTETTLAKVFYRITTLPEDDKSIIPLGKPISNTVVLILKDNKLCDTGEVGEICIKTPFMSKGYYGENQSQQANFVQNPLHNDYPDVIYRTGDLGKYSKERDIEFVGRTDFQVKIRGNRVELLEIEKVMRGCDGIKDAVVTAIRNIDETVLCCFYTQTDLITQESIVHYLGEYVPGYMIPSYFVLLKEFPLNFNGKIDRKSLPIPDDLLFENLSYKAPQNKMELALAEIWTDILKVRKVGIENSFFSLGGHSLSATKVVTKIYKRMNYEISLRDFFEHPTIASLAAFLQLTKQTKLAEIKPLPEAQHYEVSHAQKRLWIIEQQQGINSAYNMSGVYLLPKQFNLDVLEIALHTVIERHESLRTSFVSIDGEPRQVIHNDVNFKIAGIDQANEEFTVQRIAHWTQFILDVPFNLEDRHLLRAVVIHGSTKNLFLFSMHHIISDGWSIQVLVHEVLSVYANITMGRPHELTPLPNQYKDFAAWQNKLIQSGKLAEERKYWLNVLSGNLPVIALPIDFPRPKKKAFAGATCRFSLGTDSSEYIRQTCRSHDISLFMYLLGLIKLCLCKVTGQTEIIVGTPVAGRQHPDLENQIGLFLNYLVLRTSIHREESLYTYFDRQRQNILAAFNAQLYPFDLLTGDIHIEVENSRNPFYDVLVVMNNAELNISNDDSELMKALEIEEVLPAETTSKLDLTFFIQDEKDIQIAMEYDSQLFRPDTILRIQTCFSKILDNIYKNENALIGAILSEAASESEQELLRANLGTIDDRF